MNHASLPSDIVRHIERLRTMQEVLSQGIKMGSKLN